VRSHAFSEKIFNVSVNVAVSLSSSSLVLNWQTNNCAVVVSYVFLFHFISFYFILFYFILFHFIFDYVTLNKG
jgi:hypothetical protein